MNRWHIEPGQYVAVSVLFFIGVLASPCGGQTLPSAPQAQNQAGQTPPATMNAGSSGQADVEPALRESPGVAPTVSSSAGKKFGSSGRGLPGMPGGPPIKGAMGYQDPSSRYMRPPAIPPLFCDPAVNIPC